MLEMLKCLRQAYCSVLGVVVFSGALFEMVVSMVSQNLSGMLKCFR